jgi:hypothetical protein
MIHDRAMFGGLEIPKERWRSGNETQKIIPFHEIIPGSADRVNDDLCPNSGSSCFPGIMVKK